MYVLEADQVDVLTLTVHTLSRVRTPRNPDSSANSGVMSGKPIGSIESTSIEPSSMRWRAPILMWGRIQIGCCR